MVPRTTLIAVLVGVEMSIAYAMVVALGGGPKSTQAMASAPVFRHSHYGGTGDRLSADPMTFPAGPHPALAIDIGMADVIVDAVPGARIDVTVGDARMHVGSSVPILARNDGGTIRISADESDTWSIFGDSRTVHVTAPPATTVTIANAGDIWLNGLRASAQITSGAHFHPDDGIIVRDFRGSLRASTSNGNVDVIDAVCPELHVSSSNGRVTLTRVRADQIDASSSNGRVNGTGLHLRDGRVVSSNGRVSLGFAPGADTTVSAATSNGHVNVSGLPVTSHAQSVKRAGSDDEDDDDDASPAATTVRVGTGGGLLEVHSSNGSIDLTQEG